MMKINRRDLLKLIGASTFGMALPAEILNALNGKTHVPEQGFPVRFSVESQNEDLLFVDLLGPLVGVRALTTGPPVEKEKVLRPSSFTPANWIVE
jgi:hypothetical protein